DDEFARRAELAKDYKPSELIAGILEAEGAAHSPESVARARVELGAAVVSFAPTFKELTRGGRLNVVEFFEQAFAHLERSHRFVGGAQPHLTEGLVSHVWDCDVATLVICEMGRQNGI